MQQLSPDMRACVEECLTCHGICLSMALNHCLPMGGKHTELSHFKLMMACAELCQTAANLMLIGTDFHRRTCGLCAELCEACAESCAAVGEMDPCVVACRSCAAHCRTMAAG